MSRWRKVGIALLLLVGLLQPLGQLAGWRVLKGLGMVLVASPLPLVFSHFRGLETFSSEFTLQVTTRSGRVVATRLTPKNYALLGGPYNRRNVYGAVAAYGVKLTEGSEPDLVRGVLTYGFCKGPLLEPLALAEPVRSARIHVVNRYSVPPVDATLEVRCD